MEKKKIFVDGSAGTTGLRINERLEKRSDVILMQVDEDLRKDPEYRKKMINESDYTFLCLPDAAAIEAVSFLDKDNDHTVIIDASTAHRTNPDWAYGLPELGKEFRDKIATNRLIAVPGCYASGFNMLVCPMVKMGIMGSDYPVSVTALSGYSGAGKKAIEFYESDQKTEDLFAPREYALTQKHKHLPEMKKISGLDREPLFTPVVDDYYAGMVVTVPIYTYLLKEKLTPVEIHQKFTEFYKDSVFIKVMPFGKEEEYSGFFAANAMAGKDSAQIFITGNEERILLSARFDNLGKGASGAAVQCLNISMGIDETTGLVL